MTHTDAGGSAHEMTTRNTCKIENDVEIDPLKMCDIHVNRAVQAETRHKLMERT